MIPKGTFKLRDSAVGPVEAPEAPAGAQIDLIRLTDIDDAPTLEGVMDQINDVTDTLDLIKQSGDQQVGLVGERLLEPFRVEFVDPQLDGYEVCFEVQEVEDAGDIAVSGDHDGDGCAAGPAEAWLTLGEKPDEYVTDAWIRPPGAGVNETRDFLSATFTATGVELATLRIRDASGANVSAVETKAGDELELVAVGFNATNEFIPQVNVTWTLVGVGGLDLPEEEPWGKNVTYESKQVNDIDSPAVITAQWDSDGKFTASVQVEVTPGDLDNIQVRDEPEGQGEVVNNFTITSGDNINLHAAGYDEFGNFMPIEEIEEEVSWEVDDGLGSFDPHEGLESSFTAGDTGTGTITVSHPGVDDFEIDVEVESASLHSLKIRDKPGGDGEAITELDPFTAGDTTVLYAAGYDEYGNFIRDYNLGNVAGFGWVLDPPELGNFNETKEELTLELAVENPATIEAVYKNGEEISASVEVDHVKPASPAQLGVYHSPATAGEAFSVEVRIEDEFGNLNKSAGGAQIHLEASGNSTALEGEMEKAVGQGGITTFGDLEYTTAETITLTANTTIDTEGEDLDLDGTVEIEVVPNDLAYLEIRDDSGTVSTETDPFVVKAGTSVKLFAAGYDDYDNYVRDFDVDWTVGNGDPDTAGALVFHSNEAGNFTVKANHDDVDEVAAYISVVPADFQVVKVLDAQGGGGTVVEELVGLTAGEVVPLYVAEFDEHGNWIRDVPVEWTVEPEERGFFNHGGDRFTPRKRGEGEITPNHSDPNGDLPAIPVNVTGYGSPSEVVFIGEAADYTAGEPWDPVDVQVEDGFGNRIEDDDGTEVTLRLGTGYAPALHGEDLVQVVDGGFVSFDAVRYDVADKIWIVAEADADGNGEIDFRTSHGPYRVSPAELDSIIIRDAPDNQGSPLETIDEAAGEPVALFAAGYDAFGNYRGKETVNWTTDPADLGSFDPPDGPETTFTPQKVGIGKLHASHPDSEAEVEADLTVSPGTLDHLQVRTAPDGGGDRVDSLTIQIGNESEVHAAGYDAFENLLGNVEVQWRLDPLRLGNLGPNSGSPNATFQATEEGSGRIVLEHDGLPGDLEIPLRVTTDPVPPEAVIHAACDELECTFDATGSRPGTAPIDEYRWDLGDGTTQEGDTIDYSYHEPGDYEVALNVTDADGRHHETRHEVSVALPPGPEVSLEITTRPSPPEPGDAIIATAFIENVGSVHLLQFSVRFHVDDTIVREQHYPRLEAGESMNVSATWSAREGDHTLVVELPGHITDTTTLQVEAVEPPELGDFAQEAPGSPLLVPLLISLLLPWILRRTRTRRPPG